MGALKAISLGASLSLASPAASEPLDRWSVQIAEASARSGIPSDWIRRVMRVESAGRTTLGGRPIVSGAGAMGLMQLMPGTWRDIRALLGLGLDPYDPHDNIVAGAAYLRLMYDRFGYPGMFAAYNAGPARYAAALAGRRRLPAETRLYITKVGSRGPAGTGRTASLFAVAAASIHAAQAPPVQPSSALFVQLTTRSSERGVGEVRANSTGAEE